MSKKDKKKPEAVTEKEITAAAENSEEKEKELTPEEKLQQEIYELRHEVDVSPDR